MFFVCLSSKVQFCCVLTCVCVCVCVRFFWVIALLVLVVVDNTIYLTKLLNPYPVYCRSVRVLPKIGLVLTEMMCTKLQLVLMGTKG